MELGYNVEWKVLNTKDFGLPQNRERIFFVATKYHYFDFSKMRKKKSPPLRSFLDKEGQFEYLNKDEYTLIPKDRVKHKENSGLIFVGYRNKQGFRRGIRENTNHLSRVHRQPNRIYSIDGYHPTIPSQESSGRFFIYIPEKDLVRKLTLRECFKIMGFPSNYKLNLSRGVHTVQIGNSCGINLIEELSYQLMKQGFLDEQFTQTKIDRNNKFLQTVNKQTIFSFS